MHSTTAEQYMFDIYHFLEVNGRYSKDEFGESFYFDTKNFFVVCSQLRGSEILKLIVFFKNTDSIALLAQTPATNGHKVSFSYGDFEVLEKVKNDLTVKEKEV